MCVPTAYAKANGAYTDDDYTVDGAVYGTVDGEATCWWWLRSPGWDQDLAAGVGSVGGVHSYGHYVRDGYDCVRPALWIDLDA